MRTATKALLRVLNQTRFGLRFNDASQSVPFTLALPTGQVTLEGWIIPTTISVSSHMARSDNYGGATPGSWSGFVSTTIRPTFVVTDDGGVARTAVAAVVAQNEATHFVGTYDGANVRSYLNGVLSGGPTACTAALTGSGVRIGVLSAADSLLVDDVRVYSRALNADEVLARYQGAHLQDNLILWAGFDEGSGAIAYDYSGAALTAAIPAGPTFEQFNPWPGTEGQLVKADLYTFHDAAGAVLGRYTNVDADLTVNGNTFSASGPLFKRKSVRFFCGVEVSDFEVEITADNTKLLAGVPWLRALQNGALDGGRVLLERFVSDSWQNTGVGAITWFGGAVGPITGAGRSSATLKAKSDLNLLNIMMPRNVFSPTCQHTLYDTGCTADKTRFSRSSTAQAGSTLWTVKTTLTQAAGYFTLGTIAFTGGANAGLTRMVKSHASNGNLNLLTPLAAAPQAGDAFTVYAGCNKAKATCGANAAIVFTADSGTDTLSATAHGLATDDALLVATTGTLPSPLAANTAYHVIGATANTFQLSALLGGAAINLTTAGSGTHSVAVRGKFANLANFKGQPFVPVPEALL